VTACASLLCDACAHPGRCCTGFELNGGSFGAGETALEMLVRMATITTATNADGNPAVVLGKQPLPQPLRPRSLPPRGPDGACKPMSEDPKPIYLPSRLHFADLPGTVSLDPGNVKFLWLGPTIPVPAGPYRRPILGDEPLPTPLATPLAPQAEAGTVSQPPVASGLVTDAPSSQGAVATSADPASSNPVPDFPVETSPPVATPVPAPLPGLEAAIRACAPRLTDAQIASWVDALTETLRRNRIDTPRRIAAFVGQCAHESGGFTVMQENLNYRAERLYQVWPARFPNLAAANECARNPERLANRVYANRMGNGDEASGDGWRFRGRGLIQLTGRSNYQRFANSLGCTIEEAAQRAETPRGAGESAAFFWSANSLNTLADAWSIDAMTRKINGGTAGAAERRHLCDAALAAIGE